MLWKACDGSAEEELEVFRCSVAAGNRCIISSICCWSDGIPCAILPCLACSAIDNALL